jgi:hypothetical protein
MDIPAASSARKRDSGCITPDIHNGGGADLSEDVDRGTPCARVWEPVDRLSDFSAAATSAAEEPAQAAATGGATGGASATVAAEEPALELTAGQLAKLLSVRRNASNYRQPICISLADARAAGKLYNELRESMVAHDERDAAAQIAFVQREFTSARHIMSPMACSVYQIPPMPKPTSMVEALVGTCAVCLAV